MPNTKSTQRKYQITLNTKHQIDAEEMPNHAKHQMPNRHRGYQIMPNIKHQIDTEETPNHAST